MTADGKKPARGRPKAGAKKLIPVSAAISQPTYEQLLAIANARARSLSATIRALLTRSITKSEPSQE